MVARLRRQNGLASRGSGGDAKLASFNRPSSRTALPVILCRTRKNRFKGGDNGRVELRIYRLRDPKTRNPRGHGLPVRAVRRHRIVGISYGQDSRNKRYVVPGQSVRIAVAIDPLMMVTHDARDIGVVLNIGKNPFADRGVFFHLPTFFKG